MFLFFILRSEKGSPAPSDISDADALSQKCFSDVGNGHYSHKGSRMLKYRPNHLTVVNPYEVLDRFWNHNFIISTWIHNYIARLLVCILDNFSYYGVNKLTRGTLSLSNYFDWLPVT